MRAGSRRGITPVVAVALLMGMTVVASGGAYTFFTQATQSGMDEASASLATSTEVRSIRCQDTSAVVGISNTGDRELTADTASVFLFQDGALLDTVEKDISGADVLQPGGFSELEFPFTTYLEPGTRYTVEVSFDDADYSFERTCQGQSGDLVGYWNFDTIESRTIADATVHGNSGTFHGMEHNGTVEGIQYNGTLGETAGSESSDPAWTSGCKMDGCLDFDGDDDFVNVSALPNISDTTASYTVNFWARVDADGEQGNIVDFRAENGIYILEKGDGTIDMVHIAPDGWNSTSVDLENDTWQMWTQAWDGSHVYYYRDAELVDVQTAGKMRSAGHYPRAIGANRAQDKNYFGGETDDVRLYDRNLSHDEVRGLMDGEELLEGLAAYYPLDEESGQTAWNNAYQTAGQHGQAVRFDGTDDRVNTPLISTADKPETLTVSAWYRTDGGYNDDSLVSDEIFSPDDGFGLRPGSFRVGRGDGNGVVTASGSLVTGEWTHVAGSYDGSTVRFYQDGELVDETSFTGPYSLSSRQLVIGYNAWRNSGTFDPGYGWRGEIDDVRIYDRSLSQSEIQDDMAGGPPKQGILAYYSMDGPTGRTIWNNAYWKEGKEGGAVTFRGLDSGTYIDLGAAEELNPSTFSVGGWVRPYDTGYAYNYLFSNARDCCGPYDGIDFRLRNGELELKTWNSSASSLTSPDTFTDGEWLHVMATYNGSRMRLYEDGQLVQSSSNTGGVGSPASFDTYIGTMGYNPSQFSLNGTMDDVRLYGTALSAQQIAALYNATR